MTDTASALLRFRELLSEAIQWADDNDDTLLAVHLEEARACVEQRISEGRLP